MAEENQTEMKLVANGKADGSPDVAVGGVEVQRLINGLTDAILGSLPGYGAQLSQLDTLFVNERWQMVSNSRQLLSQAYIEHGLIQTLVNIPIDDAFRGGVEITSGQLSPAQIDDLQVWLEREDILNSIVGLAHKWKRLFGGAGILIITDQAADTKLDVDRINEKTPLSFRAVDMWELYSDLSTVSRDEQIVQDTRAGGYLDLDRTMYSFYGKKVDKSRVITMKGLTPPSFVRPRMRGWGFSIVEALVRSINQYLKSTNLAFDVLDEFKVDVFKIKNLKGTLMDANAQGKIQQRLALAARQKSFQNALTMDAEDDYQQKQVSFAGLADVMKEIRLQIASDMRMPLTKIFGISAAGFSSGQDDIENYNAMVESTVRSQAKYEILRILELACRQQFGYVPDDLKIAFKPLRILSSLDEESVKTQKFTRILQARQAGEISAKEFRDACNKDNLMPIQLDPEEKDLSPEEEETEGDAEEKRAEISGEKAPSTPQDEKNREIESEGREKGPPTAERPDGSSTRMLHSRERNWLETEVHGFLALNAAEHKRLEKLENPGHVDEGLWSKAKKASEDAFGEIRWPFVTYLYQKWGGK